MALMSMMINVVELVLLSGVVVGAWLWSRRVGGFIEDVLIAEIRRYDDRTRKRIEKLAGNGEEALGIAPEVLPERMNGMVPGQPYKVR